MQRQAFGIPEELNIENIKGKIELCLIQKTETALKESGRKNGYVYDVDFAKSIFTNNYELNQELIKTQINRYLKETLPECINNFEELKKHYHLEPIGNFSSEIIFKQDNIIVNLDYPLKVSDNLKTKSTLVNEYQATIPIRFKHILNIKQQIQTAEDKDRFISNYLIENIEVPIKQKHESNEEYNKKLLSFFSKGSKKYLKNIKIENTDYKEGTEDKLWVITNEIYPRTEIQFSYNRLPLEINNPEFNFKTKYNKNLLKYSEYLKKGAFDFDLNIIIPVSVKINDKLSFKEKGYEFNFVVPVNLDLGSGEDISEHKTKNFEIDIKTLTSDSNLENFNSPIALEDNEQVVVQIYNKDHYAAALYPEQKTISLPKQKQELNIEALLFKDYRLIGGYKTRYTLTTDDLSKNKLKLSVVKLQGYSDSIILNILNNQDYSNKVVVGFE